MSKYRAIPIDREKNINIFVKMRRMFPYHEVAMFMGEGYEVFVPGLGRRVASYARKRLSEMLGKEVIHYPAVVDNERGYIFKLSIFQDVIRECKEE